MSNCGGCASARDRCGNGLEKLYPTTAIRYGKMGLIGEFSHDPDMRFSCGGEVIIQTDRGIEIGKQVSLTCHGCEKSVDRDQMRAYAHESGGDSFRLNNGRILREATPGDLIEMRHMQDELFDKIQQCRKLAEELGLPMKIVDAEHVFGGERVIFYFMSEDRIDFRELVRQLAREFQTRIGMRQVGARDEARLLADYETCGRECCCKNFLKTLKPIGMQMAKLQKATLDPSKVSGRCGRLKCCLRYEHESYAELNKKLPRMGRWVRTETETGMVIDRQILTQLIKLRKIDGTLVTVCEEDVVERDLPPPPMPEEHTDRVDNRGPRRRGEGGDARPGRAPGTDRGNRPPRAEPPPRPSAGRPGSVTPEPLDDAVADGENDVPASDQPLDAVRREPPEAGPRSRALPLFGESAPAQDERPVANDQTDSPSTGGGDPERRRGRNRRRRRRNGGNRPAPPGSPPPGPA